MQTANGAARASHDEPAERRSARDRQTSRRATGEDLTLQHLGDLSVARADWTRLAQQAGSVFGTWEWADAWQRHLGAGAQLAIGVARRPDGEAAAILPLYVARERPARLLRFIGAGPSDELGPLCAAADLAVAAAALRRHVSETLDGSGIFLGENVWGGDRLGSQLGAITVHRAANPVLPIDGRSFDEFLASRSRNFRQQVHRRERNLAREHRLTYRITQDPERLETDMRTLIRLHAARWGAGRSTAFSGGRASLHLEFAGRALAAGWLRLWTMELDGRPVASWYGLRYNGIEHYYQAGRDPAFDQQSVGFVLLCHTIRCAFEDGMREYRFGHGADPYKRRFAECDPGLETVAVTAGLRGRLALAAINATLRSPWRVRRFALRIGAGRPQTT